MNDYNFIPAESIDGGRVPIKAWTKGVPVEATALAQLQNIAKLPFAFEHIAVMPDVHWGLGATVGSVIATKGAIVPAAVGVDLGCGMSALKLTLRADQLPDDLGALRSAIEKAVPHGRTDNGGDNDRGAWGDVPTVISYAWEAMAADERYDRIREKHPKALTGETRPMRQLGTLGTGNHFIEICVDTDGGVWIMLHSGSRGVGNRIGSYFIEKAKEQAEIYGYASYLPDKDLAWLNERTPIFDEYIDALSWAQDYAALNRAEMMDAVLAAVQAALDPLDVAGAETAVSCHHNYAAQENHFGRNVWVTRKGAVRARVGDLGIIPGSMGARSFIVAGRGNRDSFMSCSHGAGRVMSRNEAKKRFTLEDHKNATIGVECRKDADVLDETPAAYKSIEAVMAAQTDLVEIVAELKQVVCVKG